MRRALVTSVAVAMLAALARAEPPPQAPKLDPGEAQPAPDDAPARRLPAVTTICRDPGNGKCWSEAGDRDCARGRVFRVVVAGSKDVAAALAACRAPATTPPPP